MAKRHVALTRKMVEGAIYIDIEKRLNDEIPALIGEVSDGRYRCRITDKRLFKLAYGRTAVCADTNTYLNSLLDRSLTSGRKLVAFSEFELGHMKALLPHRVAEDLRKECELLKHAVENDESLETGEETDGSDEEPLGLIGSVRNNDVKAVEGHLASGTNWDLDTALFLAAWNDNTRIMELLINAGSDVDFVHEHIDSGTVKKSALMVAAEYNNVKAVKLLLKAGADPNLEGMDGDVTALEIGGDTVYDILIKAGAKGRQWVAARDRPFAAASKGDADMVSLLLKAGANVNGLDSDGWPPLHAAASERTAGMVSLLLKAGTDVNVEDSRGCTPLRWAARSSDAEMDKLLKEAGAKE